jgi:hypothetical protein
MSTQAIDRISILKEELAELKKERKEQSIALKKSKQWVSVKKRLPEPLIATGGWKEGTIRVIVWHDNRMEVCFYDEERNIFNRYNGTMAIYPEDKVDGVTHWMQSDWFLKDYYIPPYGPGIVNFLRYWWMRITYKAQDMAYDLRPKSRSSKAQLDKKVVFYRDRSGKVMTGMPENIPAPKGFEKIVCNNVYEAERFSEQQRRQERVEHGRQQAERGAIEAEFQREIRSEMTTKMLNARNATNREFMRRALENNANRKDPTAYERESYLHAEAYERGH